MKLVGVYGASGCGRGVMPLARHQLTDTELVFIDDGDHPSLVNGHPCHSWTDFLAIPAASKQVAIAISDSRIRMRLADKCVQSGIGFVEIRAENVVEMDDVILGPGAILSPFVTLTSNIRIGSHFHANLYSYVEHDCIIGDYVTFAPGVRCNGNVLIEDHAYIGAGATLRQGKPGTPLRIGKGALVGMGAVVTKDVPDGATVVGIPARPLK